MTTITNADYRKINHCAKKKKVAVAIVYCPNGVSSDDINRGLKMYYGLREKKGFIDFDEIYIVNKKQIKVIQNK